MWNMPRLGAILVSEAGMFWWTSSVPMSSYPSLSRLCLVRIRIRLFPLLLWGCDLVCESVRKTGLLSAHFAVKQCRNPVDLAALAIRLPVSLYLWLHLPSVSQSYYLCFLVTWRWYDSCWIWIPGGSLTHMFLFLEPLLLWPLVSLWYFGGSFVRVIFLCAGEGANVTAISKSPSASIVANYWPIP